MSTSSDLKKVTKTLVSVAYPELQKNEIVTSWGKTSSFGQVRWSDDDDTIQIKLNKSVKSWHQAGIIGLLSHELSHPSQKDSGFKERKTDEDVISRGLGPYLAVERVIAGKYEDHIIQRGKDRYLGYRSIRKLLTEIEVKNLDVLMSNLNLKPVKASHRHSFSHDSILYEKDGISTIVIDGENFVIPQGMIDPDIKIVHRDGFVLVYADEEIIGQYEEFDF
ncbi:MAG: hypothetical protein ACW98U_03390 [Candidatus Thorarchaeota archaeon]